MYFKDASDKFEIQTCIHSDIMKDHHEMDMVITLDTFASQFPIAMNENSFI